MSIIDEEKFARLFYKNSVIYLLRIILENFYNFLRSVKKELYKNYEMNHYHSADT